MRQKEKIEWLKTHYFANFIATRERVFNELSDKQTMFCVCGKLATGLHERYCSRFNKTVDKETCKRLEYLLKQKLENQTNTGRTGIAETSKTVTTWVNGELTTKSA